MEESLHKSNKKTKFMRRVIPYHLARERKKKKDLPSVSTLRDTIRRGYLWKYSEKRVLSGSSWKCKYFVLTNDELYFFSTRRDIISEAIHLSQVTDCFEVGVTEQRKANNVFAIITEKNGSQNENQSEKYLFSAETRSEMIQWINDIMSKIKKNNHNCVSTIENGSRNKENEFNTVTLDSDQVRRDIKKKESENSNYLISGKESQDCDLHDLHNLTYKYSSDEDDENMYKSWDRQLTKSSNKEIKSNGSIQNESPPTIRTRLSSSYQGSLPTVTTSRSPRTPRSVETSLRRRVLEKRSTNFNISLDTSNDDDDNSSQDLYHHYQPLNTHHEKISYMEMNAPKKTNAAQDSSLLNPTLKSVDEKMENMNKILCQLESQASQLLKEVSAAHALVHGELLMAEKVKTEFNSLLTQLNSVLYNTENQIALRQGRRASTLHQNSYSQTLPKTKVSDL